MGNYIPQLRFARDDRSADEKVGRFILTKE